MQNETPALPELWDNTWELRSSEKIKLASLEKGAEVVGYFYSSNEIPIKDRTTQKMKEVTNYTFEHVEDRANKFSFIGNAGFNAEFNNANINTGDLVKIVVCGKVPLGTNTVNTYKIYVSAIKTKM